MTVTQQPLAWDRFVAHLDEAAQAFRTRDQDGYFQHLQAARELLPQVGADMAGLSRWPA